MNKTLYISDLDGTLLNSGAELSRFTSAALNELITGKGAAFTVATARGHTSAKAVLGGLPLREPLILMNGAVIYDPVRESFEKVYTFETETAEAVIETLRVHKATGFMYALYEGEFRTYHERHINEPQKAFISERISRYKQSFYHTDGFGSAALDSVFYFTLLDYFDALKPLCDAFAAIGSVCVNFYSDNYGEGLWYLEIAARGASKKNAAEYVKKARGFERIVCFGDNYNDLPLFEAADVRIAVANANDSVKAAADHICGANDADGVVRWLLENI